MTPNYTASVDFLKRFHPDRKWVLTAIHPDKEHKPRTLTATYDESTIDGCLAWLATKGETYNLYFSVNECKTHMMKKAERTDIARMWYLHVDIDPRAGEELVAEQERILKKLKTFPGLPPASVITFSGGGYQGFWALEAPIVIDGDLANAEHAKLWNLDIELKLGADNCHNIDRVMRLPGSLNRPDEKKRAKGRTVALAEVVEFNEKKFGLDRFSQAKQIATGKKADAVDIGVAAPATKAVIATPTNIRRIGSVDELPETIAQRVKAIIVQGHDPLEPNKYGSSRSEWLFLVVVALTKAQVTADTIFSIITDDRFGISASVLDKGTRYEKYAMRQIERARDEAEHPWLKAMNGQFSIVESWNGKCRVLEEQHDEVMKRNRLVKQTFEDFQNRFMNRQVDMGFNDDGKPISKPLGLWWLQQPNRRQFKRIVFSPGIEVEDAYNMWRGFGCEPIQGDCTLFLEHLRTVICNNEEAHYNYLIRWMANAVQSPASPGYTAVVMKGAQGTGKSYVAKTFGSLFGRHFMQVTDPKHLVGSFNAHLRDCVVLFGDEAFFAGDKKHESILKMIITEEMLTIEAKGIDAEQSGNYIHLLMASNDHWVVPAGVGDRRFFVLNVSGSHKEDRSYFGPMIEQMEKGGREALLFFLMTLDLTEFDVRVLPKTDELQKQKLYSLAAEENWWRDKLMEGRLLPEHGSWQGAVAFGDLYYDYILYCRTSDGYRKATKSALNMMLTKYLPDGWPKTYHADTTIEVMAMDGTRKMVEKPKMVSFPTLAECRLSWQKHFGGNDSFEQAGTPNAQGDLYKDVR